MIGYNYLVEKDDLERFGPNDLKQYHFVAVLYLSNSFKSLHPAERPLIRTHIAKCLSDRVLFVFEQELETLTDDAFLKQLCSLAERTKTGEWISFFGISEEVGDSMFLKPTTVALCPPKRDSESRYPYSEAIRICLSELVMKVSAGVLESITFHWSSRSMNLCIPRSHLIKELRRKIGPVEAVIEGDGVSKLSLDRGTLQKAERYEPITIPVLKQLAAYLEIGPTQIQYYQVVGHAQTLRQLRHMSGLTLHQLLEQFQLHNPGYFDVLEAGQLIPEEALRYAHLRYKEILNRRIFMKDLLDFDRMKQLGGF